MHKVESLFNLLTKNTGYYFALMLHSFKRYLAPFSGFVEFGDMDVDSNDADSCQLLPTNDYCRLLPNAWLPTTA